MCTAHCAVRIAATALSTRAVAVRMPLALRQWALPEGGGNWQRTSRDWRRASVELSVVGWREPGPKKRI